jgi:soluble lytic murein transglycosylase-like protein
VLTASWSAFPAAFLLMATLALQPEGAGAAEGRIFGSVDDNGTVVLTDDPGNARLPVVVAGAAPPEPGTVTPRAQALPATAATANGGRQTPFARIIREASRQANVPPELLQAVITVESGFNPRAVSRKGARGLMQLMPATARRFHARDSFNPQQNVLAGARYLRQLLDRFKGDLHLALAAYNAGEHAVIRAGYRIPAFAETQLYVPRVIANYHRLLAGE